MDRNQFQNEPVQTKTHSPFRVSLGVLIICILLTGIFVFTATFICYSIYCQKQVEAAYGRFSEFDKLTEIAELYDKVYLYDIDKELLDEMLTMSYIYCCGDKYAHYYTAEEWEKAPYRIAAKIHPLTVEQNALTSFKSRTTLVPCRANTIGPGLFLQADYAIGGADGTLGRGMQWQGMSLWMTLRHGVNPWITSSYIPTLAGRLFFLKELAGPLEAECN